MITPSLLAEVTINTILGHKVFNSKIVNINSKLLSARGDLSFRLELDYWRGYIDTKLDWFINSKNILHYFKYRCCSDRYLTLNDDKNNYTPIELLKKRIVEELEQIYNSNNLNTQLAFSISNNYVLIKFNRSIVSCAIVKAVIANDFHFENIKNCKKNFNLKVESDAESEITNMRLNLLRKVSLNLLKCQNYNIRSEKCNFNYVLTIKSEGRIDENYDRCLCGAVLNNNRKKEIIWTEEIYLQRKLEKIKELNAQKHSNTYIDENSVEKDANKIANAAITYELLSVKHSSPVIIENSNSLDNSIKEAAFILYNNVRMTTILSKYIKSVEKKDFPEIIPIEKMESFHNITDEDSWSLVYNYIIKYADVIRASVKVEPKFDINIHLLWSFICNLCHDFSKYYRKNKILMRGVNINNQIINLISERLHLLKALQIILQNSLSLLEIDELKYM